MPEEIWNKVDDYLDRMIVDQDHALLAALKDSEEADLPRINVSPPQGKMLHILARSLSAKRILEMGTLGAYSTIWLARALPDDGEMLSLEVNQKHAEVSRRNLERANLSKKVKIILGPALDSLSTLYKNGSKPFDFIFIDADKQNYPGYLDWAIKLSHPGSMIIVDNVVRKGSIIEAGNTDPNVKGVNEMLSKIRSYKNIIATAIQTVGVKGHDGFALIYVT
ncbi:MAG: O-methyltransferase [Thermoplasmataceae archaeon]|jgi:predicted O-methyltransferase YrrM